jgi:hypothetical protein
MIENKDNEGFREAKSFNYISQILYVSEEDKKKYHLVTIPTSKFLDTMNPFTGKIISRSSYEKLISDDTFIRIINRGFVYLYANNCDSLDAEFIRKYKLGVVHCVDKEYIEARLSSRLDKDIIEYIETNADKCSAEIIGAYTEHMEGLDCISDVHYISGFQLYDAQHRPPVDIIFKLGQTYEER